MDNKPNDDELTDNRVNEAENKAGANPSSELGASESTQEQAQLRPAGDEPEGVQTTDQVDQEVVSAMGGEATKPDSSPPKSDISDNLHPKTGEPILDDQPPKKGLFAKKWVKLGFPVAAIIVIAALVYLFLFYLPGKPGAVYSSSLKRTGKALDMLIAYEKGNYHKDYQSVALNGSANISTKFDKYSIALHGNYDKNQNTQTQLKVDSKSTGNKNSHLKGEFDVRTIKPEKQTSPDIYFKISGFDSIFSLLAGSTFSKYQGEWLYLDHELVDKYKNIALDQQEDEKTKKPSKDQVFDAIERVQEVNKKYVFDADKDKAILIKKKLIGSETKYGRSTYHYQMSYSKAHLIGYVKALSKALDASKLNDWSKKTYHKNLSDEYDSKAQIQYLKKHAVNDYTFDMWSDRDTRLVEAVRFKDPDNVKNTVTIAQTYDGGDVYPFQIVYKTDQSVEPAHYLSPVSSPELGPPNFKKTSETSIKMTYDVRSSKYTAEIVYKQNDNGNKTSAVFHIDATPSSKHVKPDKPKNAISLGKILEATIANIERKAETTTAQTTMAESSAYLELYASDHNGGYPASKKIFIAWLKTQSTGNKKALANKLSSSIYKYISSPPGCDNKTSRCSNYKLMDLKYNLTRNGGLSSSFGDDEHHLSTQPGIIKST